MARQQMASMLPEPVIEAMHPHRMESRVIQQYGELAGCGGIALQDGLNVFSNRSQHALASSIGIRRIRNYLNGEEGCAQSIARSTLALNPDARALFA
jgi:hypothetical protein